MIDEAEFRTIPGSAHALGYRGNRMFMAQMDEMLAANWRKFRMWEEGSFGGSDVVCYFQGNGERSRPEHIEPYRAMLTNPPNPNPPGPVEEHLLAALAAWPIFGGSEAKTEINLALDEARKMGV